MGDFVQGLGFVFQLWSRAKNRHYDELSTLPHRKVALVLGCVPKLGDGRDNQYFRHRVSAASELYHARKVDFLLVSGDPLRAGFNEPEAMRDALLMLGVKGERIVMDNHGYRTFDSIARAQCVYGQTEITVVSQRFHNERALYLAEALGLGGVAYSARDAGSGQGYATRLRELIARLRAVLDVHVFHTIPKVTGPTVVIGEVS